MKFGKFLLVVLIAEFAFGCATKTMLGGDRIRLEGAYSGHLQDVWFDGAAGHIYWVNSTDLIKTDARGRILKHVKVNEHHAGVEVRDGRVYVAVCAEEKTTPESRVMIGEYDAETLDLITMHVVDIQDRAGSLAILDDGTFLVGCLRPKDISPAQVRFHHIGKDYRLIRSYVRDNVPVMHGIEVIKRHEKDFYLCFWGVDKDMRPLEFDTVRLDGDFKETWRGKMEASDGFVFEGDDVWIGVSRKDKDGEFYRSCLVRRKFSEIADATEKYGQHLVEPKCCGFNERKGVDQ